MGKTKTDFQALGEREISEVDNSITFELKSLITADKSRITDIARHIVDQVADGSLDPVQAFSHAKKICELSTLLVANLRPYMVDNINISKGEVYVKNNIEFTQAETGVSYDYSSCGDLTYEKILDKFKEADKEKKEREAFLKTVKTPTGAFDMESGESWVIQPPIKKGTLSVKSELK